MAYIGTSASPGAAARLERLEDNLFGNLTDRQGGLEALTDGWVSASSYGLTHTGLAAAQTAAAAAGKGILVGRQVILTGAAGTISVPIRFEGGGSLDLQSGGSVTLTGALDAPLTQIFYANGGTLTFSAKVTHVVPQWWGAKGDGVTDDTAAFSAGCAAAVAAKKPLWLGDAKLYLSTQAASINTDGLVLVGNGALNLYSQIPEDWGVLVNAGGTTISQRFDAMRTTLGAFPGAVIYSKYNGPIFTGKKLSGHGFTVIGYPANASNSAFVQTTPTSYAQPGGWSQAFAELHDATFAYFGSHGLWAKGGLEMTEIRNVQVGHCMGTCLNVTQTLGVTSPIEYIEIAGGAYTNGLLGNIRLDGVTKHIRIHDVLLNSAGQLGRRADATYGMGFVIAAETDIVYPIYVRPCPASQAVIVAAASIEVVRNYAENANAIVKFDAAADGTPLYVDVGVEQNHLLVLQNTVRHVAAFMHRILGLRTAQNFTQYGPIFWIDAGEGPAFRTVNMAESRDVDNPAIFDSYPMLGTAREPVAVKETGAAQGGFIFQGSGVPDNTYGNNGDSYFRTDTPANHSQRLYVKAAGAWLASGPTVSGDRGDTSQTLTVGTDAQVQRWATTLTANRTVTCSTTGAANGDTFRIVRSGLGAFTLDVVGLKTIPSATAASVDVTYTGSAWVLTGYGAL